MQISFSLNDLYENYSAGLLDKKNFEGSIFSAIKENGRCYGLVGWSREESDDYISSLYQRISRAIDAYEDTGASFESYIGSIVRLTAKEYRTRKMRNYSEETAAWIAHIPDMFVCENEPEYDMHGVSDNNEPEKLNNPRQLLILILKCSSHVSNEFTEKISPRLGYDPAVLGEMINHLKRQRDKREIDIKALREKINFQFHRSILCEKKLLALPPDSVVAWRLRKQLEKARARMEKARRKLARTRLDPSNSQIAKLLGISKGTVDSVLYNLKAQSTVLGKVPGIKASP